MESNDRSIDLDRESPRLSAADQQVLHSIKAAHVLYDDYLRIADLANISKLASGDAETPAPPRTDLPLTLASFAACQSGVI